jgi:hypothetical protein
MRTPAVALYRLTQAGLLRGASLLAPGNARGEWLREWQAELWHARRETETQGGSSEDAERSLIAFCLGALKDALCVRRLAAKGKAPLVLFKGSATQCLVSLCAMLAASFFMARLLPGVNAALHPAQYRLDPGTVLIQNSPSEDDSRATVSGAMFEDWSTRRQRYFDGLAFYRVARERVNGEGNGSVSWEVAHATPNLFGMLGMAMVPGLAVNDGDRGVPKLILGEAAWKRDFGGRPDVVGTTVRVNNRAVRIAGVLPIGSWRLPGKAEVWLLDPDATAGGKGFVVAHLTTLGRAEMIADRVGIGAANNSDDEDSELWAISLKERTRGPLGIYLFMVFLALLSLPAITSVSLGEYSFSTHKPSWARRISRLSFLGAKIALLLAIAYFASADLAYAQTTGYSVAAENIQLFSSFVICLFGMRWVFLDQRQRCPVCLRRVTHPAQVGQASRMFLAWNGTELMCASGHTLLHVPGLPTSWFETQRWLYLDTSWEFLFAGTNPT